MSQGLAVPAAPLSRQDGWVIHGRELLEQVGDVPLPESRVAEPWEGPGKCRVIPATGDPGGVMQDPERTQRFHQCELREIELTKQLVTFHDRGPRGLLAGGVA